MLLTIIIILGFFIGSFLNVVIDRLPRREQILSGRSHCDKCKRSLKWNDLIPIVSWVMLGGKCRYCNTQIPSRNTIVEIATSVVFASVVLFTGPYNPYSIVSMMTLFLNIAIMCALIAIFFIDLKHMIIPDILLFVIVIATIVIWLVLPYPIYPVFVVNHILSALGAGGFFLALVLMTKGRGMGLGDVKFALVMGLLLGFPNVLYGLYMAFLTGAFFSVILILRRKKRFGQTIPFGPFLVIGTYFAHLNLLSPIGTYVFPF